MSIDDPKHPFDAAPSDTPELLQRELALDRRTSRAPTSEALRARTEPMRPQATRPLPPTQPGHAPLPDYAAADAEPPTQVGQLSRGEELTQVAQPPAPRPPTIPTQAARPVSAQGSAQGAKVTTTGQRPPAPHQAPPSPTDWAELQRRGGAPSVPIVITPAEPAQGGSVPPGQALSLRPREGGAPMRPPERPSRPLERPAPPGIAPVAEQVAPPRAPLPQTRVAPALHVPSHGADAPAPREPAHPPMAPAARPLPAHMLVTQPGIPGPYPKRPPLPTPMVAEVAPPALAATAPPEPARVAEPPRPRAAPAHRSSAPLPREEAKVTTDSTVMATPASLVRRLAASLVDLSLIALVAGFFLAGAVLIIAPKGLSLTHGLLAIALPALLLSAVLSFVYTTVFAFLFQGKTPGRRLAGIRLVDRTGSAPGPGHALLRAALSLVSFGLFLSGFWLGLFDRRGQTLHDKLTHTFVVRFLDA